MAGLKSSATDKAFLQVSNVSVVFPVTRGVVFRRNVGQVNAVDGVDLSVTRGTTLGIVGESGCGKTTLAKAVLRMLRPTSGRIFFSGRDIQELNGAELAAYRRQIQVVLQDPYSSLDPRMKIGSIITEPIRDGGRRAQRSKRALELLELVGLDRSAAERYPHQFSGGQRQRIAIARALAPSPQLLVLDEPTSALDVSIRAQVLNLLKDLQERLGLTYVLISHDLATISYMSSEIAVMYLGRVVEGGPSELVYRAPKHPYTGVLMASAAMTSQPFPGVIASGEIPSAMEVPQGCRFHPRCPLRNALGNPVECETEDPALRVLPSGQSAACHFAGTQESAHSRQRSWSKPDSSPAGSAHDSKQPIEAE